MQNQTDTDPLVRVVPIIQEKAEKAITRAVTRGVIYASLILFAISLIFAILLAILGIIGAH
ncbi:MAG: hypothetical protein LUG84_02720 [Akkermansiaceae bacterium]|nr:hypothetical protein [Akkermansiaceae bacterium]